MPDQRKTVLITGCSPGGIGNSFAREFHAKGLRVFATARSRSVLADLEALGIETLDLEVDNEESVTKARREVERLTGGGLDVLVNNAGRNYTVPAMEAQQDEILKTFEVNLFAVVRMCQEFAPLLIKSKGTIVQLGSLAGTMPFVFGSIYNASKAALHSFSDSLRLELEPFDVQVLTIITGGVRSRITRTERFLIDDSLYAPIQEHYDRRVKFSQEGAMPNEAYAASVVGSVLKEISRHERRRKWSTWLFGSSTITSGLGFYWRQTRAWIWEGNGAWKVWFAHRFAPKWVLDYFMYRKFGLNLLRADVEKKASLSGREKAASTTEAKKDE
ncbi:NAD(P)-binding protein [Xylona heveae TC161]|uniref:NAD(P)-binding protein n=1 Tax=Xylona heveae (strain CBS 132557 / TC161) TaxID=1328760 RepID=A0A165GZ64_XYLHT|nr:NAD(P)-binding protein [Xylona heveae TC161]KZF22785.1 NAD(P)-binding protein [Xylona heveae TC161]